MNITVLLAGGSGSRMEKANFPKQYLKVAGKTILEYSILSFSDVEAIDGILLVVDEQHIEFVRNLTKFYKKVKWIISGGSTRMWSVFNAIKYLSTICDDTDKLIISDGVRPCILKNEVLNILAELDEYNCVTTGIECYETLLKLSRSGNETEKIIPRDNIFRQTSPEGYIYKYLKMLYLYAEEDAITTYRNIGIDQLFELGLKVKVIRCSPLNIKITKREDLVLLEGILQSGLIKEFNSSYDKLFSEVEILH